MKFSENWLRQHVKTGATRDELAATLTAIGLEVEEMSVLGEQLWGDAEIVWVGAGRIDDVLYKREEAKPETSIVYGLVEE